MGLEGRSSVDESSVNAVSARVVVDGHPTVTKGLFVSFLRPAASSSAVATVSSTSIRISAPDQPLYSGHLAGGIHFIALPFSVPTFVDSLSLFSSRPSSPSPCTYSVESRVADLRLALEFGPDGHMLTPSGMAGIRVHAAQSDRIEAMLDR